MSILSLFRKDLFLLHVFVCVLCVCMSVYVNATCVQEYVELLEGRVTRGCELSDVGATNAT